MNIKTFLLSITLLFSTQAQGEPLALSAFFIAFGTKLGLITTAGGAAGASAAASTGATVVLTTKGVAVITVASLGTGGFLGYKLEKYWNKTYQSLPENTQKTINALDHEALKQQLDKLNIEKIDLEKRYTELKDINAVLADMKRICYEFEALLQQYGVNVAHLPTEQQKVYREMQILKALHIPEERVRAQA